MYKVVEKENVVYNNDNPDKQLLLSDDWSYKTFLFGLKIIDRSKITNQSFGDKLDIPNKLGFVK